MRFAVALLVIGTAGAAGCRGGDDPAAGDDAPMPIDADPADAHPVGHLDKSAGCVSNFGNSLTNGFGRMDGTIVAILAPGNTSCPAPNADHLIIEVSDGSDVYRMVVEMQSSGTNPDVGLAERDHALVGPAWSAGWHPGLSFDYVNDMGTHRTDFTPKPMLDLADIITFRLDKGAKISVFGTVEDQPESAHLIHRKFTGEDGAIIAHPDSSPHYFLMRFDNQLF